jgi:hypothetical protein
LIAFLLVDLRQPITDKDIIFKKENAHIPPVNSLIYFHMHYFLLLLQGCTFTADILEARVLNLGICDGCDVPYAQLLSSWCYVSRVSFFFPFLFQLCI